MFRLEGGSHLARSEQCDVRVDLESDQDLNTFLYEHTPSTVSACEAELQEFFVSTSPVPELGQLVAPRHMSPEIYRVSIDEEHRNPISRVDHSDYRKVIEDLKGDERVFIRLQAPCCEELEQLSGLVNEKILRRIQNDSDRDAPDSTRYPEPGKSDSSYQMHLSFNRGQIKRDPDYGKVSDIEMHKVHTIISDNYTIVIHKTEVPEIDRIINGFDDDEYDDLIDRKTPFLADVVSSVMEHNSNHVVSSIHNWIRIDEVNYLNERWPHFCSRLLDIKTKMAELVVGNDNIAGQLAAFLRLDEDGDDRSRIDRNKLFLSPIGSAAEQLTERARNCVEKIDNHIQAGNQTVSKIPMPSEKIVKDLTSIAVINGFFFFGIQPVKLVQSMLPHMTEAAAYGVTFAAMAGLSVAAYVAKSYIDNKSQG